MRSEETPFFIGIAKLPQIEPFLNKVFKEGTVRSLILFGSYLSKILEIKDPYTRILLVTSFSASFALNHQNFDPNLNFKMIPFVCC